MRVVFANDTSNLHGFYATLAQKVDPFFNPKTNLGTSANLFVGMMDSKLGEIRDTVNFTPIECTMF